MYQSIYLFDSDRTLIYNFFFICHIKWITGVIGIFHDTYNKQRETDLKIFCETQPFLSYYFHYFYHLTLNFFVKYLFKFHSLSQIKILQYFSM